jgi:hypothetical protein
MWDAWGGDAGIRWAQNKLEEIRKIRVENTNIVSEAPGAGVAFEIEEDPTLAQDFVRYYSPFQKQIIKDFLKDVVQVYGI